MAGRIVFRLMRIIDSRIAYVDGIGPVMFKIDFKYGRIWAYKWEVGRVN